MRNGGDKDSRIHEDEQGDSSTLEFITINLNPYRAVLSQLFM